MRHVQRLVAIAALSGLALSGLAISGCKKSEEEQELAEALAKAQAEAAAARKSGKAAGATAGAAGAQAGQAAKAAGEAASAAGAAGAQAGQAAATAAQGAAAAGQAAAQAMAGVLGALGAGGKGVGANKKLGKVVNWRKLVPFVPDKVGGYQAERPLKGSTAGIGGLQQSRVKRRYARGDKKLRLEIIDTSMVPMLRTGFAMARSMHRDSTEGITRGLDVSSQPGVLQWRSSSKRAKLTLLVGGRFLVALKLRPVKGGDEVDEIVSLAKSLDLGALAKLKAK